MPRSARTAFVGALLLFPPCLPGGRAAASPDAGPAREAAARELPLWPGTRRLDPGASCGAFAPDGKTFASGAPEDGMITLWEAATGKRLRTLRQPGGGRVTALAFARGGKLLESHTLQCEDDQTILAVRLWESATGKEIFRLASRQVQGDRRTVAFSPDYKTVAVSRENRPVRLVDVATGKDLRRLVGDEDPVVAVAFASDGKTLATLDAGHMVRVWDVASGKELRRRGWAWQASSDLAFTADGKLLVTTGSAQDQGFPPTARLWDMTTRKALFEESRALPGPASPDGRHWTVWTELRHSGATLMLRTRGREKGRVLPAPAMGLAMSPVFSADSRILAAVCGPSAGPPTGDAGELAQLWETATGKPLTRIHLPGGIGWLGFSADGQTLGLAGPKACVLQPLARCRGFGGSASALAFSPNGKYLAAGSEDGTLGVWALATGQPLRAPAGHRKAVEVITFAPDGRVLASAAQDGDVRLWNAFSGRLRHTLDVGPEAVHAFRFSEDGKTLIVQTAERSRPWDTATGREIDRFRPAAPERPR